MSRIIFILLILCSWILCSYGQSGEEDLTEPKTKEALFLNGDSLEQVRLDSLAAMLVHDDFSDNRNQWRVVMSSKMTANISEGIYHLRQKDPRSSQFLLQVVPRPDLEDFYVELAITHEGGANNLGYGLVWGVSNDERSFYALLISANRKYTIMRVENGHFQDIRQWNESQLVQGSGKPNRLGMYRRGEIMEYYINGRLVFKNRYEDTGGNLAGILLHGKLKLEADHFFVRNPAQWPSPDQLTGRK